MENIEDLKKIIISLSKEIDLLKKESKKNLASIKSLEQESRHIRVLHNSYLILNKRVDKIYSRVSSLNTTDTYKKEK